MGDGEKCCETGKFWILLGDDDGCFEVVAEILGNCVTVL